MSILASERRFAGFKGERGHASARRGPTVSRMKDSTRREQEETLRADAEAPSSTESPIRRSADLTSEMTKELAQSLSTYMRGTLRVRAYKPFILFSFGFRVNGFFLNLNTDIPLTAS